jgi:hypothetical protein
MKRNWKALWKNGSEQRKIPRNEKGGGARVHGPTNTQILCRRFPFHLSFIAKVSARIMDFSSAGGD